VAALWAGFTAFVWYAFGTVPLQLAVAGQLGLTSAQSASWIFIVWFSGAVFSIAVSAYLRQPIPITWTIPGLVFLGSLADRFTFPELVGANLVAGVLMLVLARLGVGGLIMRWLPLPVIMGMFGGSVVAYATRLVTATAEDMVVAGSAVACYLAGRSLAHPRVPPVGLAVVGGGLAVALSGTVGPQALEWSLPVLTLPEMRFSAAAVIAVSLPMVVLAMGLGNVQGLGFLVAQGYRVPIDTVSTLVGINSVVNALLGGHPATIARMGVAILASSEAGAFSERYRAVIVSALLTMLLALAAVPVASLLGALPASYMLAIAGLAMLSALQDAMEKAFGAGMRFGALTAFIVAASPITVFGITSAFWAIVAGVAASACVERHELAAYWSTRREGAFVPENFSMSRPRPERYAGAPTR
jgi:benzoate membrane transport protein